MALILNIDTAVETASICLAKDGRLLLLDKNKDQKDHAGWLHPAIEAMMNETGYKLTDMDAFTVTIGPGSYTGLRVGLATAKGFCFALQKPLIVINTLQMMANAATENAVELICPMIDARRMEVFTAIYNKKLEIIVEPLALVVDEKSFAKELALNKILFLGNGSKKFKSLCENKNAFFTEIAADASHIISFSELQFSKNHFADLAYSEPLYLKEFYFHR